MLTDTLCNIYVYVFLDCIVYSIRIHHFILILRHSTKKLITFHSYLNIPKWIMFKLVVQISPIFVVHIFRLCSLLQYNISFGNQLLMNCKFCRLESAIIYCTLRLRNVILGWYGCESLDTNTIQY